MIILATLGAEKAIEAGIEILRQGGTAVEAVEATVRLVEADYDNNIGVGVGGWPNLLGQSELDASIMDGRTLATGAVGALRGFLHPISVARQVMERLPHVMLVGEGAARFAREIGAEAYEGLPPRTQEGWEAWLAENVPAEVRKSWPPESLAPYAWRSADPARPRGTINVLARDSAGHLASAVSTSGWAWKYPGRLGDSPIIGAGNYCDDRYGAAACTGTGEWSIRLATARSVVLYQKMGYSVEQACHEAIRELCALDRRGVAGNVNIVALDCHGRPYGASMGSKPFPYMVWEEGMAAPERRETVCSEP